MKISIDGGGISTTPGKSFGNATFIENFLKALAQYDSKNQYFVYALNSKQHIVQSKNLYFQVLKPTLGWMKLRVPLEETISPKKIFLAINQAIPATKARVISFSHGLSYYNHPQLYKDYAKLFSQLSEMKKKSKYIVVSSERVKQEMEQMAINPKVIITAPFGIPYDFQTSKKQAKEKYFLFVGMNHPIKNVEFIVKQFKEVVSQKKYEEYTLYLCGPFQNYASENIKVFPDITRIKLKNIYQKATAYLAASLYESFNFPVLEALSQHCPVIGLESAIIPEMQPFADVVKTEEEFRDRMEKAIQGETKVVNIKKLQTIFSWSKYVKTIISVYNE